MASTIIEWDRHRLIVVAGDAGNKAVTLQQALSLPRDSDATPESLGQQLQTAWSTQGLSAQDVVVVLPRALATLRRIQLPAVADDELPDMVRLQAATLLSVPVESVCMDFIPLPGDGDQRDVLLATAPAETIQEIRQTLEHAGLSAAGIVVSSFAIASALASAGHLQADMNTTEAVISLRADMIEFLLLRGQTVVFSHSGTSWTSADEIERTVRAEISRGRLAATEHIGAHQIDRITLTGDAVNTAAVPDDVARRLDNAPITRLDPADSIVQGNLPLDLSATDVLAATGVISSTRRELSPGVDLINPRRPAEKRDTRRLKLLLAAAAAVIVVGTAWQWRSSTLSDLNTRADKLNDKSSELRNAWRQAKEELAQDAAIQEWSDSDLDWLAEMDRIRRTMGGTDRLLIRSFTFRANRSRTRRGTITAECLARDRQDIEEFQHRLEDSGFDVVPRPIEVGGRDPDYAMQVTLELNLPLADESS